MVTNGDRSLAASCAPVQWIDYFVRGVDVEGSINSCTHRKYQIMPQIVEFADNEPSPLKADQTDSMETKLAEISRRTAAAMEERGLKMRIFFLAGGRGALVSYGTPDEVADSDWTLIGAIVNQIVQDVMGLDRLVSRPLSCIEVRP